MDSSLKSPESSFSYQTERESTQMIPMLRERAYLHQHHLTQGLQTCQGIAARLKGCSLTPTCRGNLRYKTRVKGSTGVQPTDRTTFLAPASPRYGQTVRGSDDRNASRDGRARGTWGEGPFRVPTPPLPPSTHL